MVFASFSTVARIAGDVFSAFTISSNLMIFAGDKKCIPSTLSGWSTTEAISSIFRYEVLIYTIKEVIVWLQDLINYNSIRLGFEFSIIKFKI